MRTDPDFAAKYADIIGLYLSQPERAQAISVDPKNRICDPPAACGVARRSKCHEPFRRIVRPAAGLSCGFQGTKWVAGKTAKNGQKQAIWWIHQFNCIFEVDEKPTIQAIAHVSGFVQTSSEKIFMSMKSTYKPNGTINLFAALHGATDVVQGKTTTTKNALIFSRIWTKLSQNCRRGESSMSFSTT